jgi:hypothetical protein
MSQNNKRQKISSSPTMPTTQPLQTCQWIFDVGCMVLETGESVVILQEVKRGVWINANTIKRDCLLSACIKTFQKRVSTPRQKLTPILDDVKEYFKRFKYCVRNNIDFEGPVYMPISPTYAVYRADDVHAFDEPTPLSHLEQWRIEEERRYLELQSVVYKLDRDFQEYKYKNYYEDGKWHITTIQSPLYFPAKPPAKWLAGVEERLSRGYR